MTKNSYEQNEKDPFAEIRQSIVDGGFSRKRILNLFSDSIHKAYPNLFDQKGVHTDIICEQVNASLEENRHLPILEEDFIEFHNKRHKISIFSSLPPPQRLKNLQRSACEVVQALEVLRKQSSLVIKIASQGSVPWNLDTWSEDQCHRSDLALFLFNGDWSGSPLLGCICLGEKEADYLEYAIEGTHAHVYLGQDIWNESIKIEVVFPYLKTLADKIYQFNVASNLINSSSLSLKFKNKSDKIQILWNGKVVEEDDLPSSGHLLQTVPNKVDETSRTVKI